MIQQVSVQCSPANTDLTGQDKVWIIRKTPENAWKMNVLGEKTYLNCGIIEKLCIAYFISQPIKKTVQ